jgi:hypothetical protein
MNKKSRRKALKALAVTAPAVWVSPVVKSQLPGAHIPNQKGPVRAISRPSTLNFWPSVYLLTVLDILTAAVQGSFERTAKIVVFPLLSTRTL